MDLVELKDIAVKAARAAGEVIQGYVTKEVVTEIKPEPTSYAAQVVTEVDKKCEKIILNHLQASCERYDLAILSEETVDDGGRFKKDYFWCIDPLDGTLAFINKVPGFSVSIALVSRKGTPVVGVVYDPSGDMMYSAIKDHGAYKDDVRWKITNKNKYLTYVTDKKLSDTPQSDRIISLLDRQVEKLGLDGYHVMAGGGSVINGIRVLENGPACMIKLPKKEVGGGSLWDFAAMACIFNELGLAATNYDGSRLELNKSGDSFMNREGIFFSNFADKR